MSINLCDTCGEIDIANCSDEFTINAGMTALTAYTVFFTDHFGHQYTSSVTSGADGSLTVDTTGFIEGLFHANHGKLEMTVSTSADEETYELITVNGTAYSCLVLDFKAVN